MDCPDENDTNALLLHAAHPTVARAMLRPNNNDHTPLSSRERSRKICLLERTTSINGKLANILIADVLEGTGTTTKGRVDYVSATKKSLLSLWTKSLARVASRPSIPSFCCRLLAIIGI